MNDIFNLCVSLLENMASFLGITYKEINVIIFCIIWPLLTIVLIVIILLQRKLIQALRSMSKMSMVLLAFFFAINSASAQLPKLVAEKEKAVFQIICYDEYGTVDATGTGFFIDAKGTALSALHVLSDAKYAYIKDYKGNEYRIKSINSVNEDCDLVEFSVYAPATKFPFISISDSIPLKGSSVFTIGNPEDYTNTVATGILSGIRDKDGVKVIQTTAPISSGSSGSPLMNMNGQAIGVISYGYKVAQNLNFAYALEGRKKMEEAYGYDLTEYQYKDIRFVNKVCPTEPFLILHSFEISDTAMVLNCSYSNISIAFGDGGFIYTNIGDTTQCMYLKDPATGKRFYIKSSTLAGSPAEAESNKLGKCIFFKLVFPSIENMNAVEIGEAMKGGNWNFPKVQIPVTSNADIKLFEKYNEDNFGDVIAYMHQAEYQNAVDEISKLAKKGIGNIRTHLTAAAASYALDDLDGALMNTTQAIYLMPNYSMLHADLSTIYEDQKNHEQALAEINKAIALNGEYIEYYLQRAEIAYQMHDWVTAIHDYTKYIESGRLVDGIVYVHRGLSRIKNNDLKGCEDLQKAKELATTDREWEAFNLVMKQNCK